MGASLPPLRFSYQHQSLDQLLDDPAVLAVFGFGSEAPAAHIDARYLRVGLAPVEGPAPFEVWRSTRAVTWGRVDDIAFARDGDYCFGALELEEAAYGGIAPAAEAGYRRLCEFLGMSGCGPLLRIWNYMDAINLGTGDDERYRQFCVGRTRGMRDRFHGPYPAATAIGRQDGVRRLLVYWLCAREPGEPLENPRQVSAYRYPRRYGPTPPAFARAMVSPASQLLVSGTAAVVGHASQHPDDPVRQLEETACNIERLLKQTGRAGLREGPALVKLYLRESAQLPRVEATFEACLPREATLVLAGDVCRRELLLEVEGTWG
jgi:chorismate lyase/3-hydroxybenzoate synthase